MAFNINGQIRLVGPNNLGQIVSNIKAQLQGITANVNINVPSNVTANVQGLAQNLNQVSQAAQNISSTGPQVTSALNNVSGAAIRTTNAVSQTSKSLRTLISSQYELSKAGADGTETLRQFGEQAALAARRFVAFSVAAGSLISLFVAFKRGIGDALQFERELIRLGQVGGDSTAVIRGLGDEITRVSRVYGASSTELAQVAVTIRQAGRSAEETKSILEALAKSNLSASFDSMGQSAEGLIAIMSQFRIQGTQAAEVLGSINAVSAGLAVEARDITAAVQRAGGAFAVLAGNTREPIENLREFIAIFSSVRATTRESAESIATGLRTIFSRLQNTATLDLLKKFNIELRLSREEANALGGTNLAGNFVGVAEAIDRISTRLSGVSQQSQTFADIVEQLGGQRQLSKVLPLLTDGGSALREQARQLSRTGAFSLDDSAEKGLSGLLVKAKQTGEAFASLFRTITENTAFRGFVKSVLSLAGAFADVLSFAKPLVTVLTVLAGVKLAKTLLPIGQGFVTRLTNSAGTNISGNINQISTPKRFALGGRVEGSGPTDSQLARVSPGEFILNPKAARGIGYDRLQKYNTGGGYPKRTARGTYLDDSYVDGFRKLDVLDSEYNQIHGTGRLVLPGYSVSSQFTSQEKRAIDHYKGASYSFINERLRDGQSLSGYPTYEHLTTAVGKGRLPGGLLLHRGINDRGRDAIYRKFGFDIFDEGSIGKEFTDDGFISTSIFRGTAESYGQNLLSMMTQENDSGIFLGRKGLFRQGEVVLPPSKFRVLGGINGTTGLRRLGSGGQFSIMEVLNKALNIPVAGKGIAPDIYHALEGDSDLRKQFNNLIPKGSKFLGAGIEAAAFLSPDNSVLRASVADSRILEQIKNYGTIRPLIPDILQAKKTIPLSGSRVSGVLEQLDYLNTNFNEPQGILAAISLGKNFTRLGYETDTHLGNIGYDTSGRFKLFDPGLINRPKNPVQRFEARRRSEVSKLGNTSQFSQFFNVNPSAIPYPPTLDSINQYINEYGLTEDTGTILANPAKLLGKTVPFSKILKRATGGLFFPDETSRFSMSVLKRFGYSKKNNLPFAQPINYPSFQGRGQALPAGLGFGVSSPQSNYPAGAGFLQTLGLISPFIRSGQPAGLGFGVTSAADQRFFSVPQLPLDVANKSIPSNQELFANSLSPSKIRGFGSEYLEPANLELLKKDLGLRPSGPAILNQPQITIPPEYIGNQDAITLAKVSDKNIKAFQSKLEELGIGGIDLRLLTSGLFAVNNVDAGPGRAVRGKFDPTSRVSQYSANQSDTDKLLNVVHELLGHGGDLALGGSSYLTSRVKRSGPNAYADITRKIGYKISQIPSLSSKFKYAGTDASKLSREGLAVGVEHYVAKGLHDLGAYTADKQELARFKDLETAGVFEFLETNYLPRLAELTTGTSPESVKARKSLRRKLQIPESAYPKLLGNLSKVQGFKDGGRVVPGQGNTDSVLTSLPNGAFVIRKSSAQSIGYDNLYQMGGTDSLHSKGGGLALTMPGEFIFGPEQVSRIGTPILNAINKTGRLPAFATGGVVGNSPPNTNLLSNIGAAYNTIFGKLFTAISSLTSAIFKNEQLVEKTGSQFRIMAGQTAKAAGQSFEPTGAFGAAGLAVYKAANRVAPVGSSRLEQDLFAQTQATEFLRIQKEIQDSRKEALTLRAIQSDVGGKSHADLIASVTPNAVGAIQNTRLKAFFDENKLDVKSQADVAFGASAARQRELELKKRRLELEQAGGVTINAAGDIIPNNVPQQNKGFFQRFKDVVGLGTPAGTKEEIAQRRQIRALSLAYAAPIVAAGVESFGGTADQVAQGGSSAKFVGSQAVSGALVGASTGFLVAGPLGAAIGGVIGFVSSIAQASEDIRKAKIGSEVQKISDSLRGLSEEFAATGRISAERRNVISSGFANVAPLIAPANAADINTRLGSAATFVRSIDSIVPGVSTYSNTRENAARIIEAQSRGETLTDEQRTVLGTFNREINSNNVLSPEVLAGIQTYLQAFIRNNPGATQEQFRNEFNTITGSNRDPSIGLAAQQRLFGSADGRGLNLRFTQLQERERARRVSLTDEAQTTFLFSNIAQVSQQLAAGLDKLKNSVEQADNAIQGTGRISAVSFDASVAGRPFDANFLPSIRDASSFLGEAGAPLNNFATTLSGIFQPLQNALILAQRENRGGSESFDIGNLVKNELLSNVPGVTTDNPLINIISANAAKFRESGLLDPGADVSAIAKQLIEDAVKSFGPAVREVFEAANKRLNTVIEGLNRYNALLLQSVEFQNRAIQIRVATEKTQAQFTAQNQGLGDSATSLFFNAAQARAQFTESQGNLLNTGSIRGILGNNPGQAGAGEIGQAFRQVVSQITSFGPVTNANVARFGELQDASARLRRALESLADPTQRNADIQERLSRIQGSEQSRGSFNARYFTASPEERSNMSQGIGLIRNIVSTGRDIGSYDDEQRSQIINTLQSLGRTNLAFAGGASGEEVLNQILSRSRFGIEQAQGEGGETQNLQRQFITTLQEARAANDALAQVTRDNATVVQTQLTTSIRALDTTIANLIQQLNTLPLPETNSGLNLPSWLDEMFAPPSTTYVPSYTDAVRFGFAGGGRVPMYASAGMFAPRGTDTVPAMLTPDEFVVRREQALANQSLLEHINSSSGPVFSNGTIPPQLRTRLSGGNDEGLSSSRHETPVRYRAEGGLINATSIREWYPAWNRGLEEYLTQNSIASPENARSNQALLRRMPSLNTFIDFARTQTFEDIISRNRGPLGGAPPGPPNISAIQSYLNFIYGIDNINDFSPDPNLPGPDLGVRPAVLAPRGAEIPANIGGPPPGLPQVFGPPGVPRVPNPDVLDFPDRQQDIGLFGLRNQYQANFEANQFAVRNIGAIPEIRRDRFLENRLGLANTEIDAMTELNRTITSGSSNPFGAEGLVLAQQLNGLQGADSLYQAGIARNLRRAQNADLYYGDQAQSIRATAQGNIQNLAETRRGFGFYNPQTGQSDNLRSIGARSNLAFGANSRAFRRPIRRFEDGGPVSGPGIGDSIPAFLANGEYVINAQAVRNAGGAATFDRINRFQNGGAVGTPTGTTVTLGNNAGSPDFSRYVDASNSLSASMMIFNENAKQLAESMKNFPTNITMEAKHTVEVIINGAEAFSRIKPEIQEMIISTTKKEISRVFKEKLPDVQPD